MKFTKAPWLAAAAALAASLTPSVRASESDINIPDLHARLVFWRRAERGNTVLMIGLVVCVIGAAVRLAAVRPDAERCRCTARMSDVSNIIWETCKTYLFSSRASSSWACGS
jgi:hypothetical protein